MAHNAEPRLCLTVSIALTDTRGPQFFASYDR
jgi:hypothetical protein